MGTTTASMSTVATAQYSAAGGTVMDTRQRRRQSTLLHPSTPADERADPLTLYAAPGAEVVDTWSAAATSSILPSSSSPFFPPPVPATTTTTATDTTAAANTETAPSKRPQRPTLGPRKGSSLLHPSPPTSEAEINSGTQLKTVISVPPMKREAQWAAATAMAAAAVAPPTRTNQATHSEVPCRGLGTTSPPVEQFPRHQRVRAEEQEQENQEWGRGGGARYVDAVQNPRLRNVLAECMTGVEQTQQREGSVMHSCLSDDDDEGDGEECSGGEEITRRRVGGVDTEKKVDLIIMLKELRAT